MRTTLLAAAAVVIAFVSAAMLFADNIRVLFGMSADCLSGEATVQPRLAGKRFRTGADFESHEEAVAPSAVTEVARAACSTFAVDVDTASWTWARHMVLDLGSLPDRAGIRLEEWVNAFDYELRVPTPSEAPMAITVDGAVSPFDETKSLLRVALKGREVTTRQPANLVFLVDTSGSMKPADRLPLAQHALKVLTRQLDARDTVALVTYSGSVNVVLPTTGGGQHARIIDAIDSLQAAGGTAMGDGMELAYRLATQQVRPGTTTRVIVLTDGDANIGNKSWREMIDSVRAYVEEGVTMTTVGFGVGNYRGGQLEQLADHGNGQALYFSSVRDVQESFGRKLTQTLELVAKDVKVQVTFDPEVVKSYRLLGYENRALAAEDFKNDRVDAGEVGSGHAVTALYELTLTGGRGALGKVAVRGKHAGSEEIFEVEQPIARNSVAHALAEQSADFRFATAVALGADVLRGNELTQWPLASIAELAREAAGDNTERGDFVHLIERAAQLRATQLARAH